MDGLAPAPTVPATGSQLDNRRVLAGLMDLALLIPVALVMSMLFHGFTSGAAALTLGWALYYYFALESDHGQTLGKRLMKIRVARADGSPLDTGRVAVRTLLRPIDGIGGYLVGLVVMLATGQRRQRLGDLAAGTVVTEAQPSAATEPTQAMPEPEVAEPAQPVPESPPPPPDPLERFPDKPTGDTGIRSDQVPPLPVFEQVAEPAAAEVTEPEPELHDIVPVDRPSEPEPPTDEPVPVHEGEPEQPSRLEIISSPIDLIMQEPDEQPEDPPADQA